VVKYLSSLSAPYSHKQIQFVPTGGVNLSNLTDYLNLNTVIAVGGTWIAKSADINAGAWDTITSNCIEARKIIG
jgi:2-dehydro-3-deoxyphosphogluconate aldolase/(4S)-4-hydroxy-2-oxoglutarate aldolase